MVLGLILGAGLESIAGYEPNKIITLGVNMAAVMFILPRMVRILMEGLMPLSEDAKKFLAKKFPGKEVNIGMDAAIATGSPMVISAALIMIPVTLLLAVILPGNRVLPLVDLATLPFFMIWPVVCIQRKPVPFTNHRNIDNNCNLIHCYQLSRNCHIDRTVHRLYVPGRCKGDFFPGYRSPFSTVHYL